MARLHTSTRPFKVLRDKAELSPAEVMALSFCTQPIRKAANPRPVVRMTRQATYIARMLQRPVDGISITGSNTRVMIRPINPPRDWVNKKTPAVNRVKSKKSSVPILILLLGKYQYQSPFCANQEINTMAFLVEVMTETEFV